MTNTLHSYGAGSGIVDAPSGNNNYGIVVGTGTNAVTISNYALQTKIATGTGAGELSYGACTVDSDVTIDGSTAYFQIYRTFTNSSGAGITIQEIGIIKLITGTSYYFLLERSLSENTIADAASATLTYKISITV